MLSLRPTSSPGDDSASADHRGSIRSLVVASAALGVLALISGVSGLVVLAVVTAAAAAAAVLGSHAGPPVPAPADRPAPRRPVPDVGPVGPQDLTARLRRLHDAHVEQVNMALAEDREDLAQELSDSYMDESLALISAAGRSPVQ